MKIGILGTSDIAFRRFLPALQKCSHMSYAGVASRTPAKGTKFQEQFGGQVYHGYETLLADQSIEAVYVPLPPALHYQWGKKVLEAGKHLFMEKPFAVNLQQTEELLCLAQKKNLAVQENYMFLYHRQLKKIKELIADGTLGELRLIRASFGFPKRAEGDFRYNKALGGGALLDCGGYPVRLAAELLEGDSHIIQARLCQPRGYEVDLYGSAVLENREGLCAQVSFGMDNAYQCNLEVWGSQATLITRRIFTAGPDVKPELILRTSFNEQTLTLESDDHFLHSIDRFFHGIQDKSVRVEDTKAILAQSKKIEELRLVSEQNLDK